MEKKSQDTQERFTQSKLHEVNLSQPIGNELTDEQKQALHVKKGQNNHHVDERGGN